MVPDKENQIYFFLKHRNRQVRVTLEFSPQPEGKAGQEFISSLKAIYLERAAAKDRGKDHE